MVKNSIDNINYKSYLNADIVNLCGKLGYIHYLAVWISQIQNKR
jgi:hypothetical protein